MRIAVTVDEAFRQLADNRARNGMENLFSCLPERIAVIHSLDHALITALHEPGCAQAQGFRHERPGVADNLAGSKVVGQERSP
jgi:hypothetical protein